MSFLLAGTLFCLLGSAADEAASPAIVGGTASEGDTAVFLLDIDKGDPQGHILCSATLIAPSSLLTAGHCLAGAQTVRATNAPSWSVNPAVWYPVRETEVYPDYQVSQPTRHDLAFALLDTPIDMVVPLPWNDEPLQGLDGSALRAVGYGTGATAGEPLGIRRSVDLRIRDLRPTILELGDDAGHGICHGDSGGPSLHTFPDGVERLVGVHSFTTRADCSDGGDVRADAYARFIVNWLVAKEGMPQKAEPPGPPSCGDTPLFLWGLPWAGRGWWKRLKRSVSALPTVTPRGSS